MAVRAEGDVAGLHIARLRHQLVADAVRAVDIFDPVFCREGIAFREVAGVVQLAGRDQVVVDQDHFVRIPDLREAHLLKFIRHKGDKNIVDHDAVDVDGDDLSGSDGFTSDVVRDDFFNQCHTHLLTPFRSRSGAAWP